MAKRDLKVELVQNAIAAGEAVDNSNEGLHKALKELVLYARKYDWNLIGQWFVARWDWKKEQRELVTHSVLEWCKQVVQVEVSDEGKVTPKLEAEEYNAQWRKELTATPWYILARQLQKFKVPELDKAMDTYAKALAKAEELGETPDYDNMISELLKRRNAAKATKGHKNWVAQAQEAAEKAGLESISDLVKAA